MGKIFEEANKLLKGKYKFFTTPGHKQGKGYLKFKNILRYDLTEVFGLDNLHKPTECIKDSLNELSEFYGSKKSYYLLNGSTSGIQIMIFSVFNEFDEVLIERGCHVSIMNSISLRKLKVNYINREIYNVDLLLPDEFSKIDYRDENIILNNIKDCIHKNPKIKGVILTNPNYYGFYINQKEIYEYLRKKNISLLIDSAHGAHIKAFNKTIECPNKFCDISVMSAHKTLAAFTQGAYLHVNNEKIINKVDEYFSVFTTTSPSYLTMISLEKSLEDCKKYFKRKDVLRKRCNDFKKHINRDAYMYAIENSHIYCKSNGNFYYDDTRICLKFKFKNLNSKDLYDYLFMKKIICEMIFFNGIVLIPTIYTKVKDLKYLESKLKKFDYNFKENYIFELVLKVCEAKYEKKIEPYEVKDRKYRFIKFKESVGKISFNDIFLYPPGVPIIFRGEKILIEHIVLINEYKKLCYDVNGLFKDEYVKIVEE